MGREAVWVVAVAALLAVPACADEQAAGGRDGPSFQAVAETLCHVQVSLAEGNVGDARTVFEDQVHDDLHRLAARLEEIDRAAAGRLLEATQRLEDAFRMRVDPESLTAVLGVLQRAVSEGADAAGLPQPLCREGAV